MVHFKCYPEAQQAIIEEEIEKVDTVLKDYRALDEQQILDSVANRMMERCRKQNKLPDDADRELFAKVANRLLERHLGHGSKVSDLTKQIHQKQVENILKQK